VSPKEYRQAQMQLAQREFRQDVLDKMQEMWALRIDTWGTRRRHVAERLGAHHMAAVRWFEAPGVQSLRTLGSISHVMGFHMDIKCEPRPWRVWFKWKDED
jgi:hypothetical protein